VWKDEGEEKEKIRWKSTARKNGENREGGEGEKAERRKNVSMREVK
jgi:hypothetical protein